MTLATDSFNHGRGQKSTISGKATRNEHTGALIKTPPVSDAYREGYDRTFGGKPSEFVDGYVPEAEPTPPAPPVVHPNEAAALEDIRRAAWRVC